MNADFGFEFDQSMIARYLDRRQSELVAMEAAIGKGELAFVSHIGHQWKGNATTFGFPRLAELGRDLEDAAENFNAARVREVLTEVKTVLAAEDIKRSSAPALNPTP